MRYLALLGVFAGVLWAQDPAPAFEVASVKVAAPFEPSASVLQKARGCGKPDPAMLRCNGATLKMLVMRAYNLQDYQVDGPAWMETERYDVTAKVPEGADAGDVPAMLQGLLAQRFTLKFHKETRDLPAYDLTIAKGGPKLQAVDTDKLPDHMTALKSGPGGRGVELPPVSAMPAGAMVMLFGESPTRGVRGNMKIENLAHYLTTALERPVFDRTGLLGIYAIDLAYRPDGIASTGADGAVPDASVPTASIFEALQESLGLKLEAKKSPGLILVVDSANKVPTAN